MTKQENIQRIQQEWEKLFSVVSSFDDDQKLKPRFVGEWSLKDLMSHISSWESVALERVGRMRRNEQVEFIPDDQIDEWNKKFYEQRREWKLIVVEGEFENVHTRLIQEVEQLPESAWDTNESNVCEWLPECTFVHYAEHRARIEGKMGAAQSTTINQRSAS